MEQLLKGIGEGKLLESPPHLEPEDSLFSPTMFNVIKEYRLTVGEHLMGALALEAQSLAPSWEREEIATLVCTPAFYPEWALWVVGERRAGFWVLMTEADQNIWYSTRGGVEIHHSPTMKKSELAIDLGGEICDVWRSILSQTRYPKEPWGGCDGVSYHFAYSKKGIPAMAGKTWCPGAATTPGKLVSLAYMLKDYVRDPANQDAFLHAINEHLAWFRSHSN